MAAKVKKSFKNDLNPAMNFISQPLNNSKDYEEPAEPAEETSEDDSFVAVRAETKSRRVQLLIQPTLHAKIKSKANREGKSFNDMVHTILANAVVK